MLQHGRFWENQSQPGDCYSRWAAPCLGFLLGTIFVHQYQRIMMYNITVCPGGRRTKGLVCGFHVERGVREDGWIEHLSGFALDVWLITWFTLTSWAISPKIWLFLLLPSPWAGKTNWKAQQGSPCCLKIFNFLFHLSPSHNTVHFYNSRMKGCYVAVIGMLMMKGRPPVHCTKHSCSRSQRARAAHSLKFEAARSKLGKSGLWWMAMMVDGHDGNDRWWLRWLPCHVCQED